LSVIFRLLFPSVILKGHSLRQRWVASAARRGVDGDCEVKALRRNNNKQVNFQSIFVSLTLHKKRSYRDALTGTLDDMHTRHDRFTALYLVHFLEFFISVSVFAPMLPRSRHELGVWPLP
jgi:hypothetical protein